MKADRILFCYLERGAVTLSLHRQFPSYKYLVCLLRLPLVLKRLRANVYQSVTSGKMRPLWRKLVFLSVTFCDKSHLLSPLRLVFVRRLHRPSSRKVSPVSLVSQTQIRRGPVSSLPQVCLFI